MENILLIETIYLAVIVFCTLAIFFKARKLYSFSSYIGLKYYSSAFLYLALGFSARYLVMLIKISKGDPGVIADFGISTLVMGFFLVLPGLFLFYSMIWKRFEKEHYSGKLRLNELLIYLIAFAIAYIDTIIQGFLLMYLSQITLFAALSFISIKRYSKHKNNYLQLFSISMALFLLVWIFNLIGQYLISLIPTLRIYVYLLTLSACIILFSITIKLDSDKI